MKEIQLTNCDEITLVDDDIYELVGHKKWYKSTWGYAVRFEGPFRKTWQLRLHRIALNAPKGIEVDHINRNRLDNRRCNLRLCTKAQNQGNRGGSGGKSGFKGVCFDRGKFVAAITKNCKHYHLGRFRTAEEAAVAYNVAAKEHFGEFALLNDV